MDPFASIRLAIKALSKIDVIHIPFGIKVAIAAADPFDLCIYRELKRGVPHPCVCGAQFSKETLIRSASSKAFAARICAHSHVKLI